MSIMSGKKKPYSTKKKQCQDIFNEMLFGFQMFTERGNLARKPFKYISMN